MTISVGKVIASAWRGMPQRKSGGGGLGSRFDFFSRRKKETITSNGSGVSVRFGG